MSSDADETLYVVTHVDVIPTYTAQGEELLRQFAAESRHDAGVTRCEILQELGRPNHFSIVSVWENRHAFDAHVAADHTRRFREKLHPLLGSPFDDRLHRLQP